MKTIYVLALLFLFSLIINSDLMAQETIQAKPIQQKLAPSLPSNAPPLPPKRIQLLYEVSSISMEQSEEKAAAIEVTDLLESIEDQSFQLKVLMNLFSTANIAQIHVKIGTTPGAKDFAAYSFPFDSPKALPSPFTYTRDGKTIVMSMGQVKGTTTAYHVEVMLENSAGKRSEPRYFGPE